MWGEGMRELLTNDQLLGLLANAEDSEKELRNALRTTMSTYISLLISIPGGILALASFAGNALVAPLAFLLGGVMEIVIAVVAHFHYCSDYRRQVECIVEQAKLQDILGMTDLNCYRLQEYWKEESLLPESFIRTRKKAETSDEFVEWFMKNTDVKLSKWLYTCFGVIGAAFVCVGVLSFL